MANNLTDVTIQLDSELKERSETLFQSLGMSFSAAVNTLVEQAVQQGKISIEMPEPQDFEYSAELEADDPFFNRATQAELRRRIAHAEAFPNDLIDYETLKKQANAII